MRLSLRKTDNLERPRATYQGVFLIVVSVSTMAMQDAVVKFVSAELPLWQIYVLRSLIAVSLLTALNRPELSGGSNVWETGAYGKDDEQKAVPG